MLDHIGKLVLNVSVPPQEDPSQHQPGPQKLQSMAVMAGSTEVVMGTIKEQGMLNTV